MGTRYWVATGHSQWAIGSTGGLLGLTGGPLGTTAGPLGTTARPLGTIFGPLSLTARSLGTTGGHWSVWCPVVQETPPQLSVVFSYPSAMTSDTQLLRPKTTLKRAGGDYCSAQ